MRINRHFHPYPHAAARGISIIVPIRKGLATAWRLDEYEKRSHYQKFSKRDFRLFK